MKLNDCTKDELIYLIDRCGPRPFDFELAILFYRQDKVMEQCHICQDEANALLGKYIALMKLYDGKPYGEVPDKIIQQAKRNMEKRERYIKKLEQLEAQYEKLSKRIDRLLGVKEDENERID